MGHQDIFQGRQFVLEFPVFASYKQKQLLKEKITKNNGIISYTVTRKTDYVIRDAGCDDSSYRICIAVKYGVKVVTTEFLDACLEKGKLVDSKLYIVSEVEKDAKNLFADGKIVAKMVEKPKSRSKKLSLIKTWLHKDRDGPVFHNDPYAVVKAVVLKGKEKQVGYPFCVIEIHCNLTNESEHDPCLKYCVFTHQGVLPVMSDIKHFGTKTCRFMQSANEALDVFDQLYKLYTYPPYLMTCCKTFPSHEGLGSDGFHIEDWLLASVLVEAKVAQFVADIWTEVACVLDCTLSVSLNDIQENQIVQAESLLFDISKALKTNDSAAVSNLSEEFYKVLHHRSQLPISSWSMLISEYNLCQLVKDFIFLQESITLSDQNIIEQQYFSLHCDIQVMENGSSEYQEIASLILDCKEGINLSICNIFRIHRTCEDVDFTYNIENKKLLFHGTKVENVVGILSRGMLLSEVIFSNPENADRTNGLGAGLYFTDELSAASKFAFPGKTTGRRLLLISEVALGECYDIYTTDQQLTSPPVGYNSVHGVKQRKPHIPSDFEHNEYVIYNINQQRLKYVVEFCQPSDVPTVELRPPTVDCSVLCVDPCTILSKATKDAPEEHSQLTFDVQQFLNKHNSDTTSAVVGLQSEYNDPVPLKSVHVRAKLIDLAAEVVIMQEYINDTETTIEARYVFPLDDKAAVCGFEAFSNGQHFIGRIEEKKEAQMEYKQAVESGKRAYLMDEEAPDVFKVSIGNVKPHSSVLVKIRYVTELDLDGDLISFRLPGSVSPWQQELGLKSELQSATKSADVSDVQNINTSLELFVDMPFDIKSLYSPTHEVNTKKTASHAVVTIDNNVSLNSGFQLIIGLSEIHVPRMWVEKHPKFDSSACMLTFYPEFVSDTKHDVEVILALDASNSMTGSTFSAAQQISILCLHYLPPETKFNVLVFGSIYYEAFPCARERSVEEIYEAQEFILRSQPALGSSKISHFLQSYIHLKPEANTLRSIYIITDGYLQELNPILQNASKQTCHTRIFCLGVGKFVNHHLLNKISHAGAGSYEYFDEKRKSKWASKAQSQMLKAEEPVLTDIKVEWQQFDDSETEIIQAPQQINSVFSGSRVIVYGFVPNCSLAVLKGNASGTEVSTMVFTSELGKSTGSTLHCLTTKALVRDWDSGFLDQVSMHHEVCKRYFKQKIVALSKQYSIITPLTSFVAVEEKDNKVAERYNGQPSIGEFIQDECVDFLQYLHFQTELSDEEGRGFNSGGVKRHRKMLDDSSSRSPSRSSKVDSSSKMLGKGGRLLGRGGVLRHRKVIEDDEWRKLNAAYVLQHKQTDMLSGSYSASINSQGAVGHTMSSAYEDDDYEDMGCGLFDGPEPNSSSNHMQLKTLTKAFAEHNQDTQNKFVDSNVTEGWQVQRSVNSCKMKKKSAPVRHRLACPPPPGVCYSPNSVNVSGSDDTNEERLAEVERIMTRNIMKVLERDAKLSELDDRADSLICGASQFERHIPTLMSANACAVRSDVCPKPKLRSSKKQTTIEEFKISSISFGAGLPFFSLLLKHFASNMDLDNHKTMKEQIEDMLDSFPVSENFNSEGGINIEHLPKDWNHHLWSEIQLKLVSNGINSMGSAVRDSILSLIATISFLLVICQKFCSNLFPLDLTNLSSIQNVAHKITVKFFGSEIDLCTRLTCMKSLLFITSVNQRHPLVYRTLELGNSWEEAFYFLTNGQNLIEII